jgi:hypothetical protein
MKKSIVLVSIFLVLMLMAGCAPGTTVRVTTPGLNPLTSQPDPAGRVAGAGEGLWHGIIAPVSLIMSFFAPNVRMYEVHNSGPSYDIGFLLGMALTVALIGFFIRTRR